MCDVQLFILGQNTVAKFRVEMEGYEVFAEVECMYSINGVEDYTVRIQKMDSIEQGIREEIKIKLHEKCSAEMERIRMEHIMMKDKVGV